MLKNVQFGREMFTLSPAACISVDFKKLLTDLLYDGSTLVGGKSINRKTRQSE